MDDEISVVGIEFSVVPFDCLETIEITAPDFDAESENCPPHVEAAGSTAET